METKIQVNGAFIDFYVNRKKYERLKTKRGKFNYVWRELNKILDNLKHADVGKVQGLDIRLASTTPNEFYGEERLAEMNELGWRGEDDIPKNETNVVIRYFSVTIISVILGNVGLVNFPKFIGDRFLIECSSYKII
jgi:hypothetical protein